MLLVYHRPLQRFRASSLAVVRRVQDNRLPDREAVVLHTDFMFSSGVPCYPIRRPRTLPTSTVLLLDKGPIGIGVPGPAPGGPRGKPRPDLLAGAGSQSFSPTGVRIPWLVSPLRRGRPPFRQKQLGGDGA